jgi:hypothetical protein
LLGYLKTKGHQVVAMENVKYWNYLEIIVNGESVFNASLDSLDFGGDGELDPLVVQAEKAVLNAY